MNTEYLKLHTEKAEEETQLVSCMEMRILNRYEVSVESTEPFTNDQNISHSKMHTMRVKITKTRNLKNLLRSLADE